MSAVPAEFLPPSPDYHTLFVANGSDVYIQYSGPDADFYCHLCYRCLSPGQAVVMAEGFNTVLSWFNPLH